MSVVVVMSKGERDQGSEAGSVGGSHLVRCGVGKSQGKKKQRREVSINRPASYEPAALPLRHPAIQRKRRKPKKFYKKMKIRMGIRIKTISDAQ